MKAAKSIVHVVVVLVGLSALTGCVFSKKSVGTPVYPPQPSAEVRVIGYPEVEKPAVSEVVDPYSDPSAVINRGNDLADEGRYAIAARLYKRAELMSEPGRKVHSCQFAQANCYVHLGRMAEALAILRRLDIEMDVMERSELSRQEQTLLTLVALADGKPFEYQEHAEELKPLFHNK